MPGPGQAGYLVKLFGPRVDDRDVAAVAREIVETLREARQLMATIRGLHPLLLAHLMGGRQQSGGGLGGLLAALTQGAAPQAAKAQE